MLRKYLLLLSLGFASVSAAKSHEECLKACNRMYAPVCGSDGVTYGNQCSFEIAQCEKDGLTLASTGECHARRELEQDACLRGCPRNLNVVCGSNNQSYANKCLFENAQCRDNNLTLLHTGEC